MGRFLALCYGIVCYTLAMGALLYLFGFLGSVLVPKSIDSGVPAALGKTLVIDVILLTSFGVLHSVMARQRFKKWWTRIVPQSVERSTFVLVASASVALLYWQWRPLDQIIWRTSVHWAVILWWAIYALGIAIMFAATFVIDHCDLFGLRQVWLNLLRKSHTEPGFRVAFFYGRIRHPIYLGFLVTFWATPHMTLGHLLFAIVWSAYIVIAVRYEERDLVSLYGSDYVRYRRSVPMIIPRINRTTRS
jgi:protein-S-isoprenylcysteine O-methyltransferase Ste14